MNLQLKPEDHTDGENCRWAIMALYATYCQLFTWMQSKGLQTSLMESELLELE